jgi:ribulose 1,5-bisphosphate synthetase/thiazole synthase
MVAMLDRTYDGIIIGAGHHGLVLGSYLAKAGLDILLVDRRLRYGGGLFLVSIITCIPSIIFTSPKRRGSRI